MMNCSDSAGGLGALLRRRSHEKIGESVSPVWRGSIGHVCQSEDIRISINPSYQKKKDYNAFVVKGSTSLGNSGP